MDFLEQLQGLGKRVETLKGSTNTEEATKNAFVLPFLQYLGYDVFNPLEVVPEFIADLGIKKGEKVDYAIFKDGQAVILIECKHWRETLNVHASQLHRYFHVSKARFAILTNGIEYRFYSDLDDPNKMDEKPFLEFSITSVDDILASEIKKFHKNYYDEAIITDSANELRYLKNIKELFAKELKEPSEPFIKHFVSQFYSKKITNKVYELFTNIIKKALNQYIAEMFQERLKTALANENANLKEISQQEVPLKEINEAVAEKKPITTDEEIEAYLIIKSILRKNVDVSRIHYRDALSYFSVLLDDNNRKPICRLFLDKSKKSLVTFDSEKNQVSHPIDSLDDLFKYSDLLTATVDQLLIEEKR